jgi:hypothetical protein
MSLIVTYPPHQDESGLGYYRRLAADNMLSDWRELADLAGGAHSRSALLQSDASVVADLLGLEPAWTHAASLQEARARVWGGLQRLQGDAVCPMCLAQSGHLRHAWEHAYVTVCPHHRIRLVDRCDACGEWLSPHRSHVGRCECGHDLRDLPRVPSSAAQHWLSALIGSDGRTSGGIAPTVKGVDIPALGSLVRTLCCFADPTQPALRRRATAPRSVAEAVELLAPLEPLLADWPTGFEAHVAQRIAAGKPEARTLNTLLGPWYIELRKRCQDTALEPFLQVVIDVAAVQFNGILGLDSAKAMAQDATEHMRASDAAKAIGVSASHLLECLPTGVCAYRTRRLGTRGMVFEIPRAEVSRIRELRREWVSDVEACELAGVSPSVLAHMMAAGVIRANVNWRHDLLKGGLVERRSLVELFERIQAAAEPVALHGEDDTLTWAGLTSRRMGDKHAIQSAMQAIAEGRVKALARGRRLGDTVFSRADVAAYFGTPLLEAGMSLQQLSKHTGWKWESIAHWIDTGLLASESIQLRGKPCRVVLPHQLLAFRQTYLPLADLARGMGTKSSALAKLLSGIALVGAQTLPGGATRGGLIPVAELGRLAVLGARAGQDLFVSAAPVQ